MRCVPVRSGSSQGPHREQAGGPDEAQQELLDVPAGTPLLSVERVAYTYNDTPMELRRGFYRTDSHHYHNVLG